MLETFLELCVCARVHIRAHTCAHVQLRISQTLLFYNLALVIWSCPPLRPHSILVFPPCPQCSRHTSLLLSFCSIWNSFLPGAFAIVVSLVWDAYFIDLPSQGALLLVSQVLLKCHVLGETLSDHSTKQPSNNLLSHHPAWILSIATAITICLLIVSISNLNKSCITSMPKEVSAMR